MRSFRRITKFENERRLGVLAKFRGYVEEYFNNSELDRYSDGRIENASALEARRQINLLISDAYLIVIAAGVNPMITWTPSPLVGGHIQNIDLITNVFNYDAFEIQHNKLLDIVDRTTGIYQSDKNAAFIRTFNPLFYFGLGLDFIARFPFQLAHRLGFNETKFENSLLGKLFKLLIYIAGGAASILTVLQLLELLPSFLAWLK